MALRCSLFGHAFGDPGVERTRTEQGERVVVTVREVRTCSRCGATEVVGERTEVTAAEDAEADADWEGADWGARTAPETQPDGHPEAATDPETDDGVILEGGPDDGGRAGGGGNGGRARGEWPRRERRRAEDDGDGPRPWPEAPESPGDAPDLQHGGWPEPGGEDDGFDARPGGGTDVELGDGLAPEDVAATDDVEVTDDAEIIEPSPDAGGGSGSPSSTAAGDIPPDRETEFVCPECGFAEHSTVASVRAGDVCPDCRSGYLEERPAVE